MVIQRFLGWIHPERDVNVRPWVVVVLWFDTDRVSAIGPFSPTAARVYAQARNSAARGEYVAVPVEVALSPSYWPDE